MVRKIAVRVLLSVLLIGLLVGGLNRTTAQQQPKGSQNNDEIQLSSDLILVNVTVTNAQGQFIKNLTKDHFAIKEEGKPQKIEFFGAEQTPFAVAVMLDVSGSMEDKISLARAAMSQFADQLRADDVMSIYRFSDEVKQIQEFSNSHDVSDYVWDLKANGETMIYDCLVDAVTALGKREERRRAVLLISDGMDNHSSHSLDDSIKRALAANVSVYSVDLIGASSGSTHPEELQGHAIMKQIAEKTGGRYLQTQGGTHLSEALEKVAEELRSQYTVGYYSTNDKRDGKWRKIEVALPRPDASVHARAGYYAPKDKQ